MTERSGLGPGIEAPPDDRTVEVRVPLDAALLTDALAGLLVTTSRLASEDEVASGIREDFGGTGVVERFLEKDGAVVMETDWGMGWEITPDTTIRVEEAQ